MADRVFGFIALVLAIGYAVIAFVVIKAPFQYDPLGPESWPRILSIFAILCCIYLIIRPDGTKLDIEPKTLKRILVVVTLLSAYAYFFEPLGFILSTALFCCVFARMLGASYKQTAAFGAATGVIGWVVCAKLLGLNVPGGLLLMVFRG